MTRLLALTVSMCLMSTAVQADDVTETIESALGAYEEGDVEYALEELNFAIQLLNEMKGAEFGNFLPAALEGWTLERGETSASAASMFGGGTSTEGIYSRDNEQFTITMMADSPMVTSMGALFSNPAMIGASGGKIVRVGRQKFALMDGEISGMIDNRVLIQASGNANVDDMIAQLKEIDFRALSDF